MQGMECFNCHMAGHLTRDCPTLREDEQRHGGPVCFNCGKLGHFAKECPCEKQNINNTIPMTATSSSACNPVKQEYDFILVLDFEATCVKDGSIKPCQEIIEFPVAKLNTSTLEVESIFHKYVRPTFRPELTEFCTELTGITQEMVDEGELLPDVLIAFDKWIENEGLRDKSFIFLTCGDWDLKQQLPTEAMHKYLIPPEYFSSWINVKNPVAEVTGLTRKGMKGILDHLQIELKGRHHSGIDDVHNIVEITRWLLRKGHVFRVTEESPARKFNRPV